ncbi:unnamed protein product [Arctogadus glacialis]
MFYRGQLLSSDPHSSTRHLGLLTAPLLVARPSVRVSWPGAGTAPDAVLPEVPRPDPSHNNAQQVAKRWKTSQNWEAERGWLETGVTAESGAAQCLFGWGVRLLT